MCKLSTTCSHYTVTHAMLQYKCAATSSKVYGRVWHFEVLLLYVVIFYRRTVSVKSTTVPQTHSVGQYYYFLLYGMVQCYTVPYHASGIKPGETLGVLAAFLLTGLQSVCKLRNQRERSRWPTEATKKAAKNKQKTVILLSLLACQHLWQCLWFCLNYNTFHCRFSVDEFL